ncbi:hypothetical protein [Lentisalinibacter salinarum]|uniref:hypothetical protein n=1 Tax=Lentisalinibacter salinarum TaxID=2992239 RepID=UPI003869A286
MRYMPATAVFLLIGISLLSAPVHATEHGETSGSDKTETAEPTEKPPLSEAIPENTADGFGVEDLNRDELGVDIGAVRKVVVIDGSASDDAVPYRLVVTGEIQKAEGDIEGHPATINDEASIDGEIATGRIRSGIDTYYVYGEIRVIALGDPSAATIYVDGEPVEAEKLTE